MQAQIGVNMLLKLFVAVVLIHCTILLNSVESKLVLLHVFLKLFRHGDKAPDHFLMHPSDPHKNDTFFPYGPGQLTNEGKRTMYNLGKALRQRYDKFLGDLYQPGSLDAWTSHFDRCQNSLQTALAALYPPKDASIWREGLIWQPIPYNFLREQSGDMFLGFLQDDFSKLYDSYMKTAEGLRAVDKLRPVFNYIKNHTKSNHQIANFKESFYLYCTLVTEENYGLELPKWSQEVYPQPLSDIVDMEYYLHMKTTGSRRILIGKLMKKILDDSENCIKSATKSKIHIYSGHDINLVHTLIFLGLMYKHHPGYGACLVLELHEEDNSHFIEVHYKDDKHSKFALLQFPDGEKRIYMHHFRKMIEQLFVEEVNVENVNFNGAVRIGYLKMLNLGMTLYLFSRLIS